MSKEEWKQTGKSLGGAFTGLVKSVVRSAKTGVDAASDWAEGKEKEEGQSNVFNDGTWRNTGKDLGNAFAGLGKSVLHSVKDGVDKIAPDEPKAEETKEPVSEEDVPKEKEE